MVVRLFNIKRELKAWLKEARIVFLIPLLFLVSACGQMSSNISKVSGGGSSLSPCLDNSVTTGPCKVEVSGKVVSDDFGNDITSWSNASATTTVTATISNGYYNGKSCQLTDADLVAANIKTGTNIFGVAGSLTEAYSACTDDALNAGQCSTAANRYVTATAGNDVTSWSNASATTTVTATISNGYYNGKSCQLTDADLVAANIKTGTNIFGVAGSLTEAYSACTDDALNVGQCSTAANRYVTATSGNNVIDWSNGTASTTVGASLPNAYYNGKSCEFTDADLLASNIKSGVDIFGVTGNFTGSFATAMGSSALRDPGSVPVANHMDNQTTSDQISLSAENTTYAGANLPTTGSYEYRDIPDATKDDDGYLGTSCKYAARPSVTCGTTQATIAARIADCVTANPASSTWDGATQCNRGQGTWKLVVRDGANKEVWQDQRTGLLWSSTVSSAVNWCRASGNTQLAPVTYYQSYNNAAGTPIVGNGTIGSITGGSSSVHEAITITFTNATTFTVSGANCGGGSITAGGLTATAGSTVTFGRANYCSFTITQGSTNFAANDKFTIASTSASLYSCAPGAASSLQPASPVSYCAEAGGLNAPAGENWGAGTYMAAKGRLGKNATPAVAWRLPTSEDYKLADVNGVRFVLPDMGIPGAQRPSIDASPGSTIFEWTSAVLSGNRLNSWAFFGPSGAWSNADRSSSIPARCVGRGDVHSVVGM